MVLKGNKKKGVFTLVLLIISHHIPPSAYSVPALSIILLINLSLPIYRGFSILRNIVLVYQLGGQSTPTANWNL